MLTMIESSSSPSDVNISSSLFRCSFDQLMRVSPYEFFTAKLCKALAATLLKSMSSMLESLRTSMSFESMEGCKLTIYSLGPSCIVILMIMPIV